MNRKTQNIETESYSLFFNVDHSILMLNPTISKLGFRFVKLTIEEFEEKFSLLYLFKKGSKQKGTFSFENGFELSLEFWDALSKQSYGTQIGINGEVFLLERLNPHNSNVKENKVGFKKLSVPVYDTRKTAHNILRTLRLSASGDVSLIFDVLLSKKNFRPLSYSWSHKNFGPDVTVLNDESLQAFESVYPARPSNSDFIKLAEDNFFLASDVTNYKLRYILLMTCLESLFNLGRDQISHTISRHLSLIISTNKSEFEKNYKRNKELYNLRSSIVHGGTVKENLKSASTELSELTRKAIVYCRVQNLEKKELFKKLNERGY